jgi:hypothetical protein
MTQQSEYDRMFNIDKLREMVKTQEQVCDWNGTPYMLGLYYGLELALSIMEKREPVFKELTNFKRTP